MAEIELTAVEYAQYVNNAKQSFTLPVALSNTNAGSGQRSLGILFEIPASCRNKRCKIRLDSHCNGMTPTGEYQAAGATIRLIDNTQSHIFPSEGFEYNIDNLHDDEGESNWNRSAYYNPSSSRYYSLGWYYNWTNGYAYVATTNIYTTNTAYAFITTAKYIVFTPYVYHAVANLLEAKMYLEPLDDICFNEPTYPVDVNINKTSSAIFTWGIYESAPEELALTIPPTKKHKIRYREKGSGVVHELSQTDDYNYQVVAANTFDIKHYEYQIVAYTYNDAPINGTEWKEFNVVGQNAAPSISGVTNNAIPTVSWTDQNQAAFEVRIKDAEQNIVYTSGLLVGNAQSYQITKMLPNGIYIAEVRELNIYGIYSDWGSAQFTLNPSSIAAPTNIFVSVNNKYGVEISGTPAQSAQKTYVVRRIVGTDDIEIIGIYTGGIFTDYTAKGNTYYEYSLRNYNVAYADGAFTPVEVRVKEAVIQDGRDLTNFLDLSLSSNAIFNLVKTDEADRTLYNCLGRKYPVKEMGEWINSVRTFTAYVRHEDLDRLSDINLNAPKVYYMGDHEYYACDLSIEDEGAYVGGGRLIQFVLTRIADDEGVVI